MNQETTVESSYQPHTTTPQNALRAWIQTIFHIFFFFCNLLGCQIPLMIGRCFGVGPMDRVLAYHCLFHLINIRFTGSASITVREHADLDPERPLIIVSNHQAMYDVPLLIWNFRNRPPKFISKKELQRWIPSISFAVRWGNHPTIDRKKGKQAIDQIREAGEAFEISKGVVCIYPEGTRSPSGQTKPFKSRGFEALYESMPSAQIIPVTVDGTGHVVAKKLLPIGLDSRILLDIHPEIERKGRTPEAVLKECEEVINSSLQEWRKAA